MSPLIGISCHYETKNKKGSFYNLYSNYVETIEKVGGIPLILPLIKDKKFINKILNVISGIVISGGSVEIDGSNTVRISDIKEESSLKEQGQERYIFEEYLIKAALERNMPVLGICRGNQMLNEVSGGYMQEKNIPNHLSTHKIKIKEKTLLKEILFKDLLVNSSHKQAIKEVAPGFIVSAIAEGSVIEAIESTKHGFAIGLQFHPERMIEKQPIFLKIFEEFVKTASEFKEAKEK